MKLFQFVLSLVLFSCLGCSNSAAIEAPAPEIELESTTSISNTPTPVNAPASELIAFAGQDNQSFSIGLIDSEEGTMRYVTDQKGNDYLPKWSPDGKKLAFLSDRLVTGEQNRGLDLWLVDIETGQLTQLTSGGQVSQYLNTYVWSPTGKQIAYGAFKLGVNVLTLSDQTITELGDDFVTPLDWSDDGQWLSLAEYTMHMPLAISLAILGQMEEGEGQLFDPINEKRRYRLNTATSLEWSPNSRYLAIGSYSANRGVGDLAILTMAEGEFTAETNLVDTFEVLDTGIVIDISWSPDGELIAFRFTPDKLWIERGSDDYGYIYVTDVDFTDVSAITPSDMLCNKPQWSPHGETLVFACEGSGNQENSDLWLVNKDGESLRQLTNTISYEGDPVWQPRR